MAEEQIQEQIDIEALKKESRERSFEAIPLQSESIIRKFMKAGLISLAIGFGAKKYAKDYADILTIGGTALSMYALNQDEDYSGDTMALGALFGIKYGSKAGISFLRNNPEKLSVFANHLKRADEIKRNFQFAQFGISSHFGQSFKETAYRLYQDAETESNVKAIGRFVHTTAATIASGVSNIFQNDNGIVGGIEDLFKRVSNNPTIQSYRKNVLSGEFDSLGKVARKMLEHTGVSYSDEEWSLVGFQKIKNMFSQGIFRSHSDTIRGIKQDYKDFEKEFRLFKKLQTIEESTLFQDIAGMFTEITKDGTFTVRKNRILNSDFNFNGTLQELAKRFEQEQLSRMSENKYRQLRNKAQLFEKWIKGKIPNGDEFLSHVKATDEKDFSYEDMYKLYFADKSRKALSELDRDTREHILSGKNKLFKTVSELDQDTLLPKDYIDGFNHYELLKGFKFTNVVEKNKSLGFLDKTSFDMKLATYRFGQSIESLFPSYYAPHSVFMNGMIRTWTPTGVIDTTSLMKEHIGQNILQLQSRINKSGQDDLLEMVFKKQYISEAISSNLDEQIASMPKSVRKRFNELPDGSRLDFLENKRQKLKDAYLGVGKTPPKIVTTSEFVTKEGSYKLYFQKHLLAATKEDTRVLKQNTKIDYSLQDIWNGKGIKGKLNRFLRSDFNFTPFRYDIGDGTKKGGFRLVHAQDGMYHEDDTILQAVYNRASKLTKGKIKEVKPYMPEADIFNITNANKSVEQVFERIGDNIADQILMVQGIHYSDAANQEIMNAFYRQGFGQYIKLNIEDVERKVATILMKEKDKDPEAIQLIQVIKAARERSAKIFKQLDGNSSPKELEKVIYKFTDDFTNMLETIHSSSKYQEIISKYPESNADNIFNSLQNKITLVNDIIDLIEKNKGSGAGIVQLFEDDIKQYPEWAQNLYRGIFQDLYPAIRKSIAQHLEVAGDESELHGILKQIEVPHAEMKIFEQISKARKKFRDDFFNDDHFKINQGTETFQSSMWKKLKDAGKNPEEATSNPLYTPMQLLKGNRYAEVLLDDNFDRKTFEQFTKNLTTGREISVDSIKNQYSYYKEVNELYTSSMLSNRKLKNPIAPGSLIRKLSAIERASYIGNEQTNASSVILKDSLEFHKNLRESLHDLKRWMINTVTFQKEKRQKTERILNKAMEDFKKTKDTVLSKEFLNTQSSIGAFSKIPTNKLQDALETLGVSRTMAGKSFITHRLLPMMVAYSAYQAIDSFTDALLPDWMPIVGQGGITGTLAKGVAYGIWGSQALMNVTGISSAFRWLDDKTDGAISSATGNFLVGDSEETYDVLFNGKAVRVNKNRFWNTAGRQSFLGEEFDQYRPHVLYTLMNPSTGVHAHGDGYLDKWSKFFRKDFVITRYPWIMLDPYREERIAYEKYGAIYPKTQQLFVDIPVFGHLLSNTLGEIIKPTQYIGEDRWRIDDDVMINPRHKDGDPSSAPFMKFYDSNGMFNVRAYLRSGFEAIEDLKTWAGLPGFAFGKMTELVFGKENPYEQKVTLQSLTDHVSVYSDYDKYKLGGFFETTEPIRRLIDKPDNVGMIHINPLRQKLPYWMPDYYKKGNNPYMTMAYGSYIMPSGDFNQTINHINTKNQNLNRFRILSMIAPNTKEFEEMRNRVMNKEDLLSDEERTHYYESLAYAEQHNTRLYQNEYVKAKDIIEKEITIAEKLTPYEFIGTDRVRYKLDTVEHDFNKLTARYGRTKASKLIATLNSQFEEGQTYQFKISQNASFSGGIDNEGDFFRIDHASVSDELNLGNSGYRQDRTGWLLAAPFNRFRNNAMPMAFEKLFGVKDPYTEWATETVHSPYFRDWDDPMESFIAPFYNLSANSSITAAAFRMNSQQVFEQSNATTNVFGMMSTLGFAKSIMNGTINLFGGSSVNRSNEYETETEIGDLMEQMKYANGQKSIYNITGKEYLANYKKMVNEQDAVFLKDLLNVQNENKRKKILSTGNERLQTVLKAVWNRQQQVLTNENIYENTSMQAPTSINTHGVEFTKNQSALKNRIKKQLGVEYSKLDAKRQGLINSYMGGVSAQEERFIRKKAFEQYHQADVTTRSTIYHQGNINISTYY